MTDILTKHYARYQRLYKNGATRERVQSVMAEDIVAEERLAVERAEIHDIDPRDRERLETAVAYYAMEMRIAPPRLRFFKSAGLPIGGIHFKGSNTIWVGADRPFHEVARLTLHELRHCEDYDSDTPSEIRESDADRYAFARYQRV